MTKKSASRILRDQQMTSARKEANEQIKSNFIYDDLYNLYMQCANTLVSYAAGFNQLDINQVGKFFTPEQNAKVSSLIITFHNDLRVLENDLLRIYEPFQGKSGPELDLDKYMVILDSSFQFEEFLGRTAAALAPTFRNISAEVAMAIEAAKNQGVEFQVVSKEEIAAQQLQDVSVVSDVAIKDVK